MAIYKRYKSKKEHIEFGYKLNKESDLLDIKRFPNEDIKSLIEYLRPEHKFTSEQNAMRFCRRMLKDMGGLIADDIIYGANAFVLPKFNFGYITIHDKEKKEQTGKINWDTDGANYSPRICLSADAVSRSKKHYEFTFHKSADAKLKKHILEGNKYAY